MSKATQRARMAAIKHFCEMNDIALNWKKISKFVYFDIPRSSDRAYSHNEIKQVIDFSDHRVKAAFLVLASTGIRAGFLRQIKIKHLEDKGDIYKLKVYPGEDEEYLTFTTPECKATIDRYLDFRKRNGELIIGDSYLFIKQYNNMQRIRPRPFAERSLEGILQQWLVNSGIRRRDPVNRYRRKEVKRLHGFRKFFTTQLVHAKVIPEIREMLLGHKIGLASAYYKPTEDEILAEYMKAIDNLTINPENRLKRKVEMLTIEKSKVDLALSQIEEMKKKIGLS